MGSNPIDLKEFFFIKNNNINDHSLMVEHSSSTRIVSIRIRLVVIFS